MEMTIFAPSRKWLPVARFGNVYLINIFLLRFLWPPPCVTLLSDMEWGNWSNREIARKAGVDETLVRKLREPLSAVKPQITLDNPEVTPRSFFGAFAPLLGARPA